MRSLCPYRSRAKVMMNGLTMPCMTDSRRNVRQKRTKDFRRIPLRRVARVDSPLPFSDSIGASGKRKTMQAE